MNIKPSDTTIRALLESGFYKIPRFQRPYSWDLENVNDFWEDTIVADDDEYFIGSFVVYTDDYHDDLFFIVDGQQRLTTVTLLFAALRDILIEADEEELARGIHKLIERPDINNQNQYVLQSETPYPYLQEYIQKYDDPEIEPNPGKEELALQSAYQTLLQKLINRRKSIEIDPTIAQDKKADRIKDALLSIRNKLLRLKLILIILDKEDDAYLIFETLNTRGKDLTVADLVKNHLTRLLRPRIRGVDISKDKWISIQKRFDAAGVEISINSFILHSWLSKNQYTSQKALFKDIRRTVTAENASEYLDSLVSDSILYRKLLEPSAFTWVREDHIIRDSIVALNLFRVAQPLPMMLAVLRSYEKRKLTRKQTIATFLAMEKFHVQFTAVTSQRTGGGTAQMYASSARQLFEAQDNNAMNRVIHDFIEKMRQRIPTYEEFEANFGEIFFGRTQTKQRSIVRYLLRKFDNHWRGDQYGIDYETLTIEHIAPESHGEDWVVSDEKVGMMGNLILVPQSLNDRLANRPFDKKLEIMCETRIPMDNYLRNSVYWGDVQIEERTKELAGIAFRNIFRL